MHLLQVIVEFAIVLGIMVLVHELGHFAVAKWCGVRVEAFSIGFGPRLFGFRHGDTDYRISLLPLGGYVKMSGEVPGESSTGDPGEFNVHPRWQRALIAVAGPVANFILSFFLLLGLGMFHHEVDAYLDGPAVVDYVSLNSPAAHAGVAPGDTIIGVNGKRNPRWEDIFKECVVNSGRPMPVTFSHNGMESTASLPCNMDTKSQQLGDAELPSGLIPRVQPNALGVYAVSPNTPADRAGLKAGDEILRVDNFVPHSADPALVTYLHDRAGAPLTLTVQRGGQTLALPVTPEKMATTSGEMDYRLGFTNRRIPTRVEHLGVFAAAKQSIVDNLDDSTLILRILKGMFTAKVSVKSLSGPVGMAQQIDQAAQYSYWLLVRLMSQISLNLGIFNLLPIPILDGGMLLFLFIESVMRRDLSQEIKERVYQVAFVCLILFATFVLFNDITKLRH